MLLLLGDVGSATVVETPEMGSLTSTSGAVLVMLRERLWRTWLLRANVVEAEAAEAERGDDDCGGVA